MTAPVTEADWARLRAESTAVMPDVVAKVGLPAVLLPYQRRVVGLLDSSAMPVLFVEKSRRIGLTWGLAAYAVLRAGRRKAAGGMDVMYISYAREMTREFVDACAMWARAFDIAAGAAEEVLFEKGDGDKAINAFRIRFDSGFEIIALSSAPRGLRGKQGVVIIDEAAFVDDLEALLKAALAFLMWGGQVVVCSTHLGAENPFNAQIQEILAQRSKFGHVRITFDDALKDGLFQRICLVTGKAWSPEAEAAWRQSMMDFYRDNADEELYCVPSLTSGAWLPSPLIEARMTETAKVLRLELPRDFLHRSKLERDSMMAPFLEELQEQLEALDLTPRFAFGSDFARHVDLTASSLLAIEANLRRREALAYELRGVPGDEQKLIARRVMGHVRSRLVAAAFDATGMGWTVAEDLGRIFGLREDPLSGSGLVIAVKFTEEWYRLEMPPLKAAFEDDMIRLIKDSDHLSDLRAVKLVRGIARVPALREGETGRKRHGDHAIGLALAHWASRLPWGEYAYRPVTQGAAAGRGFMFAESDDGRSGTWRQPLGARLRGGIM